MQGLGNDFVFVEKSQLSESLNCKDVKFICDRKFGVGCDTLVVYQKKDNKITASFFNKDGSEAEICVNASRCLALLMKEKFGLLELDLKTKSKSYKTKIVDEKIFVDIGRPSFSYADLGIADKKINISRLLPELNLSQSETSYIDQVCTISVGNPHLILFLKQYIPQKIKLKIGEKLEKLPLFKNRINVSFAKIINELEIELEVFERGVGFTLACGSGANAAAFSAYKLNLVGNKVKVKQPGGNLEIFIKSDDSILQKGSANYVFEGKISIGSNEKIPKGKLKIYTDGACSGNPGPGGWGAIIIGDNSELELCGGELNTTNNRMELLGPINALKKVPEKTEIEIFTDSSYVKNGITSWIKKWERNGWKNSSNESVKNKELWIELQNQVSRHKVTWCWVKGHNGDYYNERADELARSQCKK